MQTCSSDIENVTVDKSLSDSRRLDTSKILGETTKSGIEDFDTFLQRFNTDSVFQISRVLFPMTIQLNDENYELTEEIIAKKDYHIIDFTYDDNSPNKEFQQTVNLTGDKAVIELRGIENGIMADYYFERKNGSWYLVTVTDAST
jgi:hypothetical protein